ncbi:MAG: hypothetical protein LBU87_01510 [Lactobacillales bacterium]|nr:hypothetical protein [Lactobacillales bacterium]
MQAEKLKNIFQNKDSDRQLVLRALLDDCLKCDSFKKGADDAFSIASLLRFPDLALCFVAKLMPYEDIKCFLNACYNYANSKDYRPDFYNMRSALAYFSLEDKTLMRDKLKSVQTCENLDKWHDFFMATALARMIKGQKNESFSFYPPEYPTAQKEFGQLANLISFAQHFSHEIVCHPNPDVSLAYIGFQDTLAALVFSVQQEAYDNLCAHFKITHLNVPLFPAHWCVPHIGIDKEKMKSILVNRARGILKEIDPVSQFNFESSTIYPYDQKTDHGNFMGYTPLVYQEFIPTAYPNETTQRFADWEKITQQYAHEKMPAFYHDACENVKKIAALGHAHDIILLYISGLILDKDKRRMAGEGYRQIQISLPASGSKKIIYKEPYLKDIERAVYHFDYMRPEHMPYQENDLYTLERLRKGARIFEYTFLSRTPELCKIKTHDCPAIAFFAAERLLETLAFLSGGCTLSPMGQKTLNTFAMDNFKQSTLSLGKRMHDKKDRTGAVLMMQQTFFGFADTFQNENADRFFPLSAMEYKPEISKILVHEMLDRVPGIFPNDPSGAMRVRRYIKDLFNASGHTLSPLRHDFSSSPVIRQKTSRR